MARRLAAIAIFVLIAIQAVGPIRSYDFFWHLATGRWIVDHHALPVYDPFTLAAATVPWINGEWLYQVATFAMEARIGLRGISWINALFVAAMFTIAYWFASRTRDVGLSLFATAVAFAGAEPLLGIRPAAAAALLIVLAIGLIELPLTTRTLAILYAVLTVVWMNTHPSALLAPVIAATILITDWRRWPVPVASAAALLVNPFGWNAIVAPLRLTRLIGSGEFVNAEWVPSTPEQFPLLFVTIGAIVVMYIGVRPRRDDWWRVVVFIGLAGLAVQHVRNQGVYFAPLPLLLPRMRTRKVLSIALAACAIRSEEHTSELQSQSNLVCRL